MHSCNCWFHFLLLFFFTKLHCNTIEPTKCTTTCVPYEDLDQPVKSESSLGTLRVAKGLAYSKPNVNHLIRLGESSLGAHITSKVLSCCGSLLQSILDNVNTDISESPLISKNIGINHGFSCSNLHRVPRKVFEHEPCGASVQTPSKGLMLMRMLMH